MKKGLSVPEESRPEVFITDVAAVQTSTSGGKISSMYEVNLFTFNLWLVMNLPKDFLILRSLMSSKLMALIKY